MPVVRACLWRRCVEYAQPGRSYCATHEQQLSQLGYTGSRRSNAFRSARRVVMREQRGRCAHCGKRATEVHHIGRADDDSRQNLVALCADCHASAHGHTLRA